MCLTILKEHPRCPSKPQVRLWEEYFATCEAQNTLVWQQSFPKIAYDQSMIKLVKIAVVCQGLTRVWTFVAIMFIMEYAYAIFQEIHNQRTQEHGTGLCNTTRFCTTHINCPCYQRTNACMS